MQNQRQIGFWDIVLYATAMNFGVRWLATGAAAGPAALPIWLLAAALFLAPLVIATLEMSSRYEDEGGVYAWTRRALGPFAGFLCGWIYWVCNLPFFSGQLYFIVNLLGRAIGGDIGVWLMAPLGALSASAFLVIVVGGLHALGLGSGKHLPAWGAVASIGLLVFLIGAGFWLAAARGPATNFASASYLPPLNANGAILWSTMVFAYGGAEGVALLRNETKGGVRTIARALVLVGAFLAIAYLLGTAAMLMLLPQGEASRLDGLPEALERALDEVGEGAWGPLALGLLALALLGSTSAWFGAAARLPFAAGIDRVLPAVFAKRDEKTGAPIVAIWTQTVLVIVLVALSQSGASFAAAYDFLVSMSVLSYTLPFVFLFAAYWRVQGEDTPSLTWRTPGGAKSARWIAALGLVVSASAILGSLAPSPDAVDAGAATLKLAFASFVLIASGAVFYWLRRRSA
jgi:amino acid transporter